ncbi:hypothetical protein [Winogradskyella sp.]|uniref:hypothetical protein n=1 Tax=Winogradskyella sp. TaxID=1883156 RepID=UPI0025D73C48|nr:hypothetical protein [Winogradskyella sp.]
MKTLCSTLLLIVFNLTLIAQTETDVIHNIRYINEVVSNSESLIIKKIQNIAAYYNIENADGYDAKKKSTYDVVFTETNCKIEATYNSEGEILNSSEVYLDMRLPMSLVKLILMENDKWHISDNIQKIYYSNNNGVYSIYEVEIKKDNKLKKLKFKIDSKANNNSYVALN